VRALALLLLFAAPAHADLYRWVDPATGSVKFSTLPPADPRVQADVVPYRAPPKPAAAADAVAALEQRWRAVVLQLASTQESGRDRGALREQLRTYEALRAELDRRDPAGAPRRAAETGALVERLRAR
jgi:plasmid stabilization system protein ParE